MSDTKINHTEEAMALRMAASKPDTPNQIANLLAAAQVHATLALAEQQRIANLIAYWQLHTPRSSVEAAQKPLIPVNVLPGEDFEQEIRDGLGLK